MTTNQKYSIHPENHSNIQILGSKEEIKNDEKLSIQQSEHEINQINLVDLKSKQEIKPQDLQKENKDKPILTTKSSLVNNKLKY